MAEVELASIGQRTRRRVRFENEDMDFLFLWALGYIAHGGATSGECYQAASQIRDGDPESWSLAWATMAERVQVLASQAEAAGHTISARSAYLRACSYWRFSEAVIPVNDPRAFSTWEQARDCFRRAGTLFNPPIEQLEVSFDGALLQGYMVEPPGNFRPRPTLLMVGGGRDDS